MTALRIGALAATIVALGACGSTAREPAARRASTASSTAPSATAAPSGSAALSAEPAPAPCGLSTSGGWIAGHAFWTVDVAGGGSRILFGEEDDGARSSSGVPRLRAGPLVEGDYLSMVELPHVPGAIAVRVPGGARVLFTGSDPTLLPDEGRLTFSPKGDLLAIDSDTALSVYDTSTWTRRFRAALTRRASSVRFSADGRHVVELYDEGAAVIRSATDGASLGEEEGYGALSPAGKTLALLRLEGEGEQRWTVRLVTLGPPIVKRDVPVTIPTMGGALEFQFDGESRVDVFAVVGAAMMRFGTHTTLASIDIARARDMPQAKPLRPFDDGQADIDSFAALQSTAGSLLPAGRVFVSSNLHANPFLGPTASGFVAAETSTTPASAGMGGDALALFVADTKTRRVLSTAPLPSGFGVLFMHATKDERFVYACGTTGAFIADVVTGRTSYVTEGIDCYADALRGAHIWTTTGLLDLASDEADPAWPVRLLAPDPAEACANARASTPE